MKRLAFLASFLLAATLAGNVSALTIDEFLGDGVASSSVAGTPATAITTNAGAVGGNRALYAIKNSVGAGTTRLETFLDPEFGGDTDYSLGYTQGAHTGQGIITWDGDNSVTTLTSNGLGSINFLSDGGTAVQLGVKFFDYPANQPIDLTIRMYDSAGNNGLKYTDVTVTLNQSMNFTTPFLMSFPFARFLNSGPSLVAGPNGTNFTTNTVFGPSGGVDLTKVGAIQLIINGLANSNAPDLTLDVFKTDGRCVNVPNASGAVVDECGVCLGDPNANKGKDRCGVCFFGPPGYNYQNNKVLDSCNLCPNEPNYQFPGGAKDRCGVCLSGPPPYNYNINKTLDGCNLCPNEPNYLPPSGAKDVCGVCLAGPAPYQYQNVQDTCGLCPSNPNYTRAKDPCGICFGNGTSCADCSGTPNGNNVVDICGVCAGSGTTCLDCQGTPFGTSGIDVCNLCAGDGKSCLDCKGVPFGTSVVDACGVCGGTVSNAADCNVQPQCVTVQATSEILAFEKRLVKQAKTITKKYNDEDKRNKRNRCNINTKPSTTRVESALETITDAGKDIFTKGVSICGTDCVTVSFADQVLALEPVLKVIEKETKTLAKKVQGCYKKKKIKTVQGTAGVATTIKNVQSELTQLVQDCKDKQVCK